MPTEPKSKKPTKSSEEIVFWCFFAFGIFTVLIALGGGGYALSRQTGFVNTAVSGLLIFLGLSLAGMLGSLIFLRLREKKRT